MPVVEKYKKVMVGQGGHGKSFDQGFTYSFGSPPLMGEWSAISTNSVFEMIPKDQWPKSAAILTMNNVIGMSATPTILKGLEDHGCKVVVNEVYNLPLSDATPLISKAKGRNAEYLILQGFFDDTVMIVRAAKAQRYNPKLIWNIIGSRVPAWFKEMGADGEGVLANNWFPAGLPFPGNDRIIEGSKKRFNTPDPPDFFAIAYCWMYCLEVGVKGANSLDDTKIRDFLRSKPLDLPFGKNVVFDSKGLPPPFNYTIQTKGGRNEIIWPKEYATGKLMYPRPEWSK
jgi:branched-chain amino acid transport system substrate-binding protein